MKRLRGVLFLLVTVVILSCSTVAFADSSIVDSGTCGDNVTWELDSEGVLTIKGSGDMDD